MLFVPPSIPYMVPEADAHYSSSGHTHSNTGQFTIDYLSISEFVTTSGESKVQYTVAGYLPAYTNSTTITKEIIKPDGTMGATDHESFGVPQGEVWYQTMGYVLDPFNASGWTMKVCAPEFGQCVEQNFTISFAFLDADTTPPVITVPSNLNLSTTNSDGFEFDYTSNSAFPNLAGHPITAIDTVTNSTGSYSQQLIPSCTSPDLASDFSWRMVLDWTLPGQILGWNGPFFFTAFSSGGDITFPVGTTTLTCTATDYAGNVGTASFTVTVNYTGDDVVIPTVTASAYLNATSSTGRTLNIDAGNWQTNWPDGTNHGVGYYIYDSDGNQTDWPRDGYTQSISFGFTTTVGGGHWSTWQAPIPTSMEAGTYTITSTTSECRGNHNCADPADVSDYTTTVTIPALPSDTTPPVLSLDFGGAYSNVTWSDVTSNVLVQATNSTGYNVNWTVIVDDDEDGLSQTSSCSPVGNSLFQIGTTTVTCTATDSAGNVGTASFTVTVNYTGDDVVIPTVTASAYLNATSSTGRTLLVNVGNWQSTDLPSYASSGTNHWVGYNIYDEDGQILPSIGNWYFDPVHFLFGTQPNQYGMTAWQIEIPPSWEAGTYTIVSIGPICGSYGNYPCVDPANFDSYSIGVTIPALATADTTPPVITPPSNVIFYATNSTGVTFTNGFKLSIMDGLNESVSAFGCPPYTHPTNGLLTGTLIPVGINTITCTASDAAGNVGTGTFTVTVILEGADAATDAAAEEIVIPSWIKNNAGWWADGQIDDNSFVGGLQWLISNGIMNIPPTEQGAGSDDVIPSWIKNNAGWWADGLIDDRNFVTGLQWLITNGIMVIG